MTVRPRDSFVVALAVAVSLGAQSRARGRARGRRCVCRSFLEADDEEKSAMRNLLGIEEKRIEQKMKDACQVEEDMLNCLNDPELKLKLTMEELARARKKQMDLENELAQAAESAQLAEAEEKKQLQAHITTLEPELAAAKANVSADKTQAEEKQVEVEVAALESEPSQMKKTISAEKEHAETDVAASAAAPPPPARGKFFRMFRRLFG